MADAADSAYAEGWVLPEGWEEMTSRSTGETYWFNTATGESTFDRPVQSASDAAVDLQLPPGWSMDTSEAGELYYINTVTGESTYDFPYAPAGADVLDSEQHLHEEHEEERDKPQQQLEEGPTTRQEEHMSSLQTSGLSRAYEARQLSARADESDSNSVEILTDLPAGWGAKNSRSTGAEYYVNLVTGESTFQRPTVPAAAAPSRRSASRFAWCTGTPRPRSSGVGGARQSLQSKTPSRESAAEPSAASHPLAAQAAKQNSSFDSSSSTSVALNKQFNGNMLSSDGLVMIESLDLSSGAVGSPETDQPGSAELKSFASTDPQGRLMTEPGSPAHSVDENEPVAALPLGWEIAGDKYLNIVTGEITTEYPTRAADELDMLDEELQDGYITPESEHVDVRLETSTDPGPEPESEPKAEHEREPEPEPEPEPGPGPGPGPEPEPGPGPERGHEPEHEPEPKFSQFESDPVPRPQPHSHTPPGRRSKKRAEVVRIISQPAMKRNSIIYNQPSAVHHTPQSSAFVAEEDVIVAEKAALDALAKKLATEEAALLAEEAQLMRQEQSQDSCGAAQPPVDIAEPRSQFLTKAGPTAMTPAAPTKKTSEALHEGTTARVRGAEKPHVDGTQKAEFTNPMVAKSSGSDGVTAPIARTQSSAASPKGRSRVARLQEMQRSLKLKQGKTQAGFRPAPSDALSMIGAQIRAQNISIWTVTEQFVAAINSTSGQLTTGACTAWLLALQLDTLTLNVVHEAYTQAATFSTHALFPNILVALGFKGWTNVTNPRSVVQPLDSGTDVLKCLGDRMRLWTREASILLDAMKESGVSRVDRNSFGILCIGLGLEVAPTQLTLGWNALVPPQTRDVGLDVDDFVAQVSNIGEHGGSVDKLQCFLDAIMESPRDQATATRTVTRKTTPVRRARPRTPSPPRERRDKAVDSALDTMCRYLGFNRHVPGDRNLESNPRYMQPNSSFRHRIAHASDSHDGKTFAEIHAREPVDSLRPGHHTRRAQRSRSTPDSSNSPALWDHAAALDLFQKLLNGGTPSLNSPRPTQGLTVQALHASLVGFFGLTLSRLQAEILLRKLRGGGGGACSQSEFISTFRQLAETGTLYSTGQSLSPPRRRLDTRSVTDEVAVPSTVTGSTGVPVASALEDEPDFQWPESDLHVNPREDGDEIRAYEDTPDSEGGCATPVLVHSVLRLESFARVLKCCPHVSDFQRACILQVRAQRGADQKRSTVFDKLADHSSFTGAHKVRFDSEGSGRGRSGRLDDHERVASLENMVNRTRPRMNTDSPLYCGGGIVSPGSYEHDDDRQAIFEKLNDPGHFTGAHRARFEGTTGKGKGLSGRLDDHERWCGEDDRLDRRKQNIRSVSATGRPKSPATKLRARTPKRSARKQAAAPRYMDPTRTSSSRAESTTESSRSFRGASG